MKILNQVNYVGGLGADRWIGSGLKDAFEELGHDFFWLTNDYDFGKRLDEVEPDILISSQSQLTSKNLPHFLRHRKRGMKVLLRVDSFFNQNSYTRDVLVNENPADVYYGEVENPHMDHFEKITGKRYSIVANAAHHKVHFPGVKKKKYDCDIAFLGAMMPHKKHALESLLLPLRKKYKVRIYGPNWTLKDKAYRLGGLMARKTKLPKLNQWFQDLRITVPVEEERDFYASAKICLNIHERDEATKNHVILNERTFKIPACGGFEICDYVPPLRNYFRPEEMVMADNSEGDWVRDWFRKIDLYMQNDSERKKIQEAGTSRALRDHTYLNRVKEFLSLLGL